MISAETQLYKELAILTDNQVALLPDGASALEQLTAYISHLIVNDQHKLIYILYRVDISEHRIRVLLPEQEDAAPLLAAEIIQRQLQKIRSRQQFRQDNDAIPDEDRW